MATDTHAFLFVAAFSMAFLPVVAIAEGSVGRDTVVSVGGMIGESDGVAVLVGGLDVPWASLGGGDTEGEDAIEIIDGVEKGDVLAEPDGGEEAVVGSRDSPAQVFYHTHVQFYGW